MKSIVRNSYNRNDNDHGNGTDGPLATHLRTCLTPTRLPERSRTSMPTSSRVKPARAISHDERNSATSPRRTAEISRSVDAYAPVLGVAELPAPLSDVSARSTSSIRRNLSSALCFLSFLSRDRESSAEVSSKTSGAAPLIQGD